MDHLVKEALTNLKIITPILIDKKLLATIQAKMLLQFKKID